MSKSTYSAGFCKMASHIGVDPQRLASFVMNKSAGEDRTEPGLAVKIKEAIKDYFEKGRHWYVNRPDWQKSLLGAGAGGLAGATGGAGIGAVLGKGKGAGKGALLGGLLGAMGGGAYTTDWGKLKDALAMSREEADANKARKAEEQAEAAEEEEILRDNA